MNWVNVTHTVWKIFSLKDFIWRFNEEVQ